MKIHGIAVRISLKDSENSGEDKHLNHILPKRISFSSSVILGKLAMYSGIPDSLRTCDKTKSGKRENQYHVTLLNKIENAEISCNQWFCVIEHVNMYRCQ